MATNQKTEFKFIHGITSSDKIISGKEDTLLAAYIDKNGNAVKFNEPLGLTNEKGFQDDMVAAADENRGVTIFTSTVGMLVPNCTVTNDNTLTINSFTVKEGKSRSERTTLPERVQAAFQNKNNYKNAACTIKSNSINWNRGSQNANKTQVELSIKDENGASHNSTFDNCEFTITGKVTKTEFAKASGSGTIEVYDSSLSKVTVSGAEFYKEGKCYRECNKATTVTRITTLTVSDVTTFESIDETTKAITTTNGYLVTKNSSELDNYSSSYQVTSNIVLPDTKSTVYYQLWSVKGYSYNGNLTVRTDWNEGPYVTTLKIDSSSDTHTFYDNEGNTYVGTFNSNCKGTSGNNGYKFSESKLPATLYKSRSPTYNKEKTISIKYNTDVYLGEKTYVKIWDLTKGYDAGETAPKSEPLYTEEGSIEIKSGTRMIQIDSNIYYKKSSPIEENINTDNTSLDGNTIRGKTSAPNWITDVKNNTVVKSVIIQ